LKSASNVSVEDQGLVVKHRQVKSVCHHY